jgi:hypothetical protein
VLYVIGARPQPALLAAGLTAGTCVWLGSGGRRVREPVTGLLTFLARSPVSGWVAVAVIWAVCMGIWLADPGHADWAPGSPPWHGLRDLLPWPRP